MIIDQPLIEGDIDHLGSVLSFLQLYKLSC